MMEQDFLHLK